MTRLLGHEADTDHVRSGPLAAGLVGAAHIGPTLAVTLLATLYAASVGLDPQRAVLVTAAVLTGQLSIGWSNDLVDVRRDQAVARADKPLATGELSVTSVRTACGLAVLLTVLLSLACGALAGLVHLGCVAAGWAYNLGLKSTVLSWLPYAVAFGGIPVFVSLAAPGGGLPLAEVPAAGALLGIGAHLVNVLPDLRDDAATGVRGLPHRLGEWRTRLLAVVVLVAATALLAIGASSPVLLPIVVGVAALAAVALVGRGAAPFRAAVGIAAADVLLLVLR